MGTGFTISAFQRNLLILLALLLGVAVFLQGAPRTERAYDLDSANAMGLLALRLWLEEMGHRVEPLRDGERSLPQGDLRFVFPGMRAFSNAQADSLANWIEAGGTAVIIGPLPQDRALIERFAVEANPDVALVGRMRQAQPILPEQTGEWGGPNQVRGLNLAQAPEAVAVMVAEGLGGGSRVTVALQRSGEGLIWHLDTVYDLTNVTLRNENLASLVPALLRNREGATVWIDVHHLEPDPDAATQIASLQDWLYGTRMGLTVLALCLLTVAYLAFQGVRLGPPRRESGLLRKREAAEYVAAMAGLYQRGDRRDAVARQIKQRLKAELAREIGVAGDLEDGALVRAVGENTSFAPTGSQELARLEKLLARLEQPLNDEALLDAAVEAESLAALGGRQERRRSGSQAGTARDA